MNLLDKFRAQPEWQSDDPAIRAAAVREISDDEAAQEILAEIARHDHDAEVRREAVIRLEDVGALVDVSADRDPTVRAEAQRTIRELLIESEDSDAGELGLSGLSDERDLVAVAKLARLESVSWKALSKLSEPGSLGMVARYSTRREIAGEALSRLETPEELLAVAVKTEDRVIAVRAFERLSDGHLSLDSLQQIGKQARQKAVRRRALAALSALDEMLAQPESLDHVSVCESIEALASETDLEAGRERLGDLLQRWSEIDERPGAQMASRFTRARTTAEDHLAQLDASRSAQRESVDGFGQEVAAREALCQRAEQLKDGVTAEATRQIRGEWAALPDAAGDHAGNTGNSGDVSVGALALSQRFERAMAECDGRLHELTVLEARRQALDRVVGEMESLLDSGSSVSAEQWAVLKGELNAELSQGDRRFPLSPSMPGAEEDGASASHRLQDRYEAVLERRHALAAAAKADRERAQQENLDRVLQRCRTVEGLIGSDKLRLGEAERQLRAMRRVLDSPGPLPPKARESTIRKLREAQIGLLGRVRELRDFADWQRWANFGIQEGLCRRMEALAGALDAVADDTTGDSGSPNNPYNPGKNDVAVANEFFDVMARWRQASDVPKDRGADLLRRFEAAHARVFPRCQKYFEAQDLARERNLARQRAMVDEAERLSSSSDWGKTFQAITALQEEWKALKPVPRVKQRELWNRFRAACNSFFARRKADLAERKKEWARNLDLKEALCARVEALLAAEDASAAVAETKRAQKEWKSIGTVRRNRSDVVWKRFNPACDQVFERLRARDRTAAAERAGAREALCLELEALLPAGEAAAPPEGLADTVRDLQRRWREAPEVPQRPGAQFSSRFSGGIARLVEAYSGAFQGTDLDPVRRRQRLEKLCERIEGIKATAPPEQMGASPSEVLAAKWREALANNLMGARVDAAAERRAALDEVRRAQVECRRLGNLVADEDHQVLERFHTACGQVLAWADPKNSRHSQSKSGSSSKSVLASGT